MMVETVFVQQLLVAPLLDDFAVLDDDHVISVADGAQAMGDDEAGAAFHQAVKDRISSHQTPIPHIYGGCMDSDQDYTILGAGFATSWI